MGFFLAKEGNQEPEYGQTAIGGLKVANLPGA
jgi:hypothetical protein